MVLSGAEPLEPLTAALGAAAQSVWHVRTRLKVVQAAISLERFSRHGSLQQVTLFEITRG